METNRPLAKDHPSQMRTEKAYKAAKEIYAEMLDERGMTPDDIHDVMNIIGAFLKMDYGY